MKNNGFPMKHDGFPMDPVELEGLTPGGKNGDPEMELGSKAHCGEYHGIPFFFHRKYELKKLPSGYLT